MRAQCHFGTEDIESGHSWCQTKLLWWERKGWLRWPRESGRWALQAQPLALWCRQECLWERALRGDPKECSSGQCIHGPCFHKSSLLCGVCSESLIHAQMASITKCLVRCGLSPLGPQCGRGQKSTDSPGFSKGVSTRLHRALYLLSRGNTNMAGREPPCPVCPLPVGQDCLVATHTQIHPNAVLLLFGKSVFYGDSLKLEVPIMHWEQNSFLRERFRNNWVLLEVPLLCLFLPSFPTYAPLSGFCLTAGWVISRPSSPSFLVFTF